MLCPVFLDACPDYLRSGDGPSSLLLAPVGTVRLLTLLHETFGASRHAPVVLAMFAPTDAYRAKLRQTCDQVQLLSLPEFHPDAYDASDRLLFVDPRLYCVDAAGLHAALKDNVHPLASATHLVAMARHAGGTNERLEFSPDGRVRRIQRYFDLATWPVLTGVACSLVSAACLRTSDERVTFESLTDLRNALSGRGIPSRDVPIPGPVYDLTREAEFLRLNERALMQMPHVDAPNGYVAPGATVDAGAHLIGPIVVQSGALIEAGATVAGPTVIGAGARIQASAVVTQSVVGDGVTVPAFAVVNHRAIFAADTIDDAGPLAALGDAGENAPEIDVAPGGERQALYPAVKAVIDCALAGLALVVLSPLLILIAALIKLDSRGPVFFVDRREGRGGAEFPCFKFRTMRAGAHLRQREMYARNEVDGPQFKLEKDPRLTRIGRWLRPMSLDELPQFVNIVIGQMSLVGPRPSPFRENQTCVPWRDARLSVRPGITGLWQVCRHDRPGGDFHQWIYFDLLYVQHMSPWLDVKIVVATILTRGGQNSVPVHRLIASPQLQT